MQAACLSLGCKRCCCLVFCCCAAAFAEPAAVGKAVTPLPCSPATYWFWNEIARLLTAPAGAAMSMLY